MSGSDADREPGWPLPWEHGGSCEARLEGAPRTDERIVLCNDQGDHAVGRYAVLWFDRQRPGGRQA